MIKLKLPDNWCENFFEELINFGSNGIAIKDIENKLWIALLRTAERQKFGFCLIRVKNYLKTNKGLNFVNWDSVSEDFPDLKNKIKIYLAEEKAEMKQ